MNQVVLMVEMGDHEEAASFQGRPIVFDLDSTADCARMGELARAYRREAYSAERFPRAMLAAEWFMRMGRGETARTRDPAALQLPPDASKLEVCLACGQCIIPERVAEDKAGTGAACTRCGQTFPEGHPGRPTT